MTKCNPTNERIKRKYYEWQKEAKQKSSATIENIRKSIERFEQYNHHKDFKTFNSQQAVGFKKNFAQSISKTKQSPISKSTLLSTMCHLKEFFGWIAYQQGYKKIDMGDVEYFNLSEKDTRIAKSASRKKAPTIDQIRKVIFSIPTENEIKRRNQALIAFTLLSGIRDGATASLQLKHIKLNDELIEQYGSEVNTKYSKTIFTYFFPVGDDIKQIVIDWVKYLYKVKLYGDTDPIFPRTRISHDATNSFKQDGIEPKNWQSANQIRKIFKESFLSAGIDYFPPHSFRNTLVRLGEKICRTPEDFKAWSQNLGHEHVLTTFTSYGEIPEHQQGEIIKNLLTKQKETNQNEQIAQRIVELIKKNKKNIDY